ncbi:hypothetical protein EVAR_102516_1 [Eumeta japonica]|uniref:Uncharacterized protein n=1 Tax=Eumeta variegata TaxID=151549 RepID=A0A4C2ADX8_EUMVA|nr:hypothetical protein EVAR_102516_1 [Eumeta japonica]
MGIMADSVIGRYKQESSFVVHAGEAAGKSEISGRTNNMRFLLTKTPRTLVLSRKKDFQRNRVALDEFLGDCQRTPREDQDFCLDYRRGLRGCTGPSRYLGPVMLV